MVVEVVLRVEEVAEEPACTVLLGEGKARVVSRGGESMEEKEYVGECQVRGEEHERTEESRELHHSVFDGVVEKRTGRHQLINPHVVALVEVLVQQGRVKDAMNKGGPDPTDHGAHADLEDPDEHIVSLCREDGIASNLANP